MNDKIIEKLKTLDLDHDIVGDFEIEIPVWVGDSIETPIKIKIGKSEKHIMENVIREVYEKGFDDGMTEKVKQVKSALEISL